MRKPVQWLFRACYIAPSAGNIHINCLTIDTIFQMLYGEYGLTLFSSTDITFVSFVLSQKIKELTYMHSEGILSGELKHGPLAMIDKDMPCIMIITKDNTYTVCNSNVS